MSIKIKYSFEEIQEALYDLIKEKSQNNYIIKFDENIDLSNNIDICWFCKNDITNHTGVQIIIEYYNKIGIFCSIICKDIFFSNIKHIFNFTQETKCYFPPLNLLTDSSKQKYKKFIKKLCFDYDMVKIRYEVIAKSYLNIKFLFIYDFNIICSKKLKLKTILYYNYGNNIYNFINNSCNNININKEIDFLISKTCLYCELDSAKKYIIKLNNNYICGYVCSYFCYIAFINNSYPHLPYLYKSFHQIPPAIFFEDQSIIEKYKSIENQNKLIINTMLYENKLKILIISFFKSTSS